MRIIPSTRRGAITASAVVALALAGATVGGIGIARAAVPGNASHSLAGCVNASRTADHLYTNPENFTNCPKNEAPFALTAGAQGPAGPAGPAGAQGPAGPAGPAGLSNVAADAPYSGGTLGSGQPNSGTTVPADGNVHVVWTACPSGKTAIAGGYRIGNVAEAFQEDGSAVTTEDKSVHVVDSGPAYQDGGKLVNGGLTGANDSLVPNAWETTAFNDGSQDYHVRTWVVCADVAS